MKVKIKCPNCKETVYVKNSENRYGKSIQAYCDICGWRKVMGGSELDFIQPDHLFFEALYGYDPIKEDKKKRKIMEKQKEKRKEFLSEKYDKQFKDPTHKHSRTIKREDEKLIRKIVLEGEEING